MGTDIFTKFIYLLGVKHTYTFTHKYYMEHPHKYNMYGLSSMLSNYSIENAGLHLSDIDCMCTLDVPFIAHTGDDFAIVEKCGDKEVRFIKGGKEIIAPFEEFKKICTGNVLLAETDSSSIEPHYKEHIFKERLLLFEKISILIAFSFLFITSFFTGKIIDVNEILLLVINLTGVYIGYLLVLKQLHVQSYYADKLCSLFKQSDCNNILESDAAKLFGIFGWCELGLGYFISNVFVICFVPRLMPVIAMTNVLSLFFSIWSIWYQKYKAKQWCSLCLAVMVLLWVMFILNIWFGNISTRAITAFDCAITLSLYFIFMFGTNMFVSLISKTLSTEGLQYEINSLKGNENVLSSLLGQQPHYNVAKGLSGILFGNRHSDNLITIFSNPHCNPCAQMHKRVNDLLSQSKSFCVQYVFSSFSKELDFSSKYLIAVYQQMDEIYAHEIYDEWFNGGNMDKDAFFKKHQVDVNSSDVLREFELHERWREETGLRSTPTILLRGYRLPDNYKIEDLKYIMNLVVDIR